MSDIFHEVEEDLRRDRLSKLWQRYGMVFVSIAVIAVMATAGIVFWRQYQTRQAAQSAESFSAVEKAVGANDVDGALAQYGKISAEGGAYADLALFRQAGLLIAKSDVPGALAIYDKLMNSAGDDRLKALARLRAAYAVADSETPDAVKARVAPLIGDDSAWRYEARDIQAYADYRAKRIKEAHDAYAALAADEKAPPSLRQRASQLASFMAGGGEIPAATLPAPAVVPAAPDGKTPAAPADETPAVPDGKKPATPDGKKPATPTDAPKSK